MKIALVVLLLATPLFAQDQAAIAAAACGPNGANFEVSIDDAQYTPVQPANGKALVYFVNQSGLACINGGWCVIKVGLDGAWVGAFKGG